MRRVAIISCVAVLVAACTGGGERVAKPTASENHEFARGGTLRTAFISQRWIPNTIDPQRGYNNSIFELLRCCLVRALMSYNGRPTDRGGSEVRPDLAASMPEVSPDDLTWTFHLRAGLHYAPPLEDAEITSHDVVRALEREADPSVVPEGTGYPFYYSVIQGFDAYRAGKATSISGLQTPDDHTLRITLTQPTGDLGYRMALPATAPIPALPGAPSATLGVATGHDDDYGPFLVASGP